jgi:hypothetical protein
LVSNGVGVSIALRQPKRVARQGVPAAPEQQKESRVVGSALVYVGSAVIFLWGAAHVVALKPVVGGFGPLSPDNKRIITMEWIAEGLTMVFIGVLTFLVTLRAEASAALVVRASAVMLLVMAVLSATTGARTSVVPMKLCPFVKATVAWLLLLARWG